MATNQEENEQTTGEVTFDPANLVPNPEALTATQFYVLTTKEKGIEVKNYVTVKLLEYRLFNVRLFFSH